MTKQTKQEVAVVSSQTELATIDGLSEMQGTVLLSVRAKLLKTPRLKLTNDMSDAKKAGICDVGEFFLQATGEIFGPSITIIPLITKESASLLYNKNNPPPNTEKMKNGSIVCSTFDLIKNREGVLCTKCPYDSYWGDWKNGAPRCKESIDVYAVEVNQLDKPFVFSFRKTSYPAGRELVNKIVNDPLKVPFGRAYTLSSVEGETDGQSYRKVSPQIAIVQLSKEQIQVALFQAKRLFEMFNKDMVEVESEEDVPV